MGTGKLKINVLSVIILVSGTAPDLNDYDRVVEYFGIEP
jgi:hypothetical protein